jgi:hypothetical protein
VNDPYEPNDVIEHRALTEAALRDLGQTLGQEAVERNYLTDIGFHYAVDGFIAAGWWPHSADAETRRRNRENVEMMRQRAEQTLCSLDLLSEPGRP